jgi:MscS family membrane protein
LRLIAGVQRVLRDHPRIGTDDVDVRFAALAPSSLDIEVIAWFAVPTAADFAVCRQEALLAIMKVVENAGAEFAFPTQTVHLVGNGTA